MAQVTQSLTRSRLTTSSTTPGRGLQTFSEALVRRGEALGRLLEPDAHRFQQNAVLRVMRNLISRSSIDAIVVLLLGHFLRSQAAALGRIREKKRKRLGAGQSWELMKPAQTARAK
jgi:hypothetical protein